MDILQITMERRSLKLKKTEPFDGNLAANMVGVFRIGSHEAIYNVLEVDAENKRVKLAGNAGTAWYPADQLTMVTYLGMSGDAGVPSEGSSS